MAYVVKVLAYLNEFGHPTQHVKNAKQFADKELAEAAALVADGIVTEVREVRTFTPKSNPQKLDKPVVKSKNTKKKKTNQSWMKELKK